MSKIHIHAPASIHARVVMYCPFCKRRRRILGILKGWYSPEFYCGGCGALQYEDGWKKQRKNARTCSIEYVKKHWPNALPMKQAIQYLLEDL